MFGWKVYLEKTVGAQTFTIREPFFAQSHSKAAQILSILFSHSLGMCVYTFVFMWCACLCVYSAHTCMHTCRGQRLKSGVFFSSSPLYLCVLMRLRFTILARLACQPALGILLSPPKAHSPEITDTHYYTWLLRGSRGLKFRSSCLSS